jgi:hypothetical protein
MFFTRETTISLIQHKGSGSVRRHSRRCPKSNDKKTSASGTRYRRNCGKPVSKPSATRRSTANARKLEKECDAMLRENERLHKQYEESQQLNAKLMQVIRCGANEIKLPSDSSTLEESRQAAQKDIDLDRMFREASSQVKRLDSQIDEVSGSVQRGSGLRTRQQQQHISQSYQATGFASAFGHRGATPASTKQQGSPGKGHRSLFHDL